MGNARQQGEREREKNRRRLKRDTGPVRERKQRLRPEQITDQRKHGNRGNQHPHYRRSALYPRASPQKKQGDSNHRKAGGRRWAHSSRCDGGLDAPRMTSEKFI